MFNRERIVVLGEGGFAGRVHAALNAASGNSRLIASVDGQQRAIRSASRLLLADADPSRAAALAAEVAALDKLPAQTRLWLGSGPDAPVLPQRQTDQHGGWRYLSWPRTAARILLNRWPLHFSCHARGLRAPGLLVIGSGPLAQAIVLQALRLGHYGNGRLRIDSLCADHAAQQHLFERHYPQSRRFADVGFHPLAGHSSLSARALSAAYVCLDDDQASMQASARLSAQLRQAGHVATPVFVLLDQAALGAPLRDWDGQRFPFLPLAEVCQPDVLFSDTRDTLARIIHDHYQDSIASLARDPASTPAAVSWASLDESYRDASRNQSDHVAAKLALLNCRATDNPSHARFTFDPDDVERLSRIEHDRWAADRYLAGWTHAPERDNERKHHPDLVPFDDLPEPIKDLDRFAVRLMPALLGRQNLNVQPNLFCLVWLDAAAAANKTLRGITDELLERLLERFPDRQITLLSRLANKLERQLVRRAIDEFGVALRVVFADQAGTPMDHDQDKGEFLRLLSGAEGRYRLDDALPEMAWLNDCVDVCFADQQALSRLLGDGREQHPRVVEWPTGGDKLQWGFEF